MWISVMIEFSQGSSEFLGFTQSERILGLHDRMVKSCVGARVRIPVKRCTVKI